jgi:HK97 family phage prohead protease
MPVHIEFRKAHTGAVDFAQRTIEVRVLPYDEEIDVEFQGKMMRERVDPGSFKHIDPKATRITVNRDHDYGRTVGRIVELRDEPSGAVGVTKISNTLLGDETLQLAEDRVLGASVGMGVSRSGMEVRGGLRRIFRVDVLDHVALLPNPAYAGAEVLDVREAQPAPDVAMPNLEEVLSIDGIYDLIRGRTTRYGAGKESNG